MYVCIYVYIFEKYLHLHYISCHIRLNVFDLLSHADFKSCSSGQRKKNITISVIIGVITLCMSILMLVYLWHKGFLPGRQKKEKGKALEIFYYLKKKNLRKRIHIFLF